MSNLERANTMTLPTNIYMVINDRTGVVVKVFCTSDEALAIHNRLGNAGIYTIIRPMTGGN
jgi:hypothetical protein